jgi:hypothetical protein
MSTAQITNECGTMTSDEMRYELGRLSEALPGLTKAQEDTTRTLWAAQERVDSVDVNLWCGKPTGTLKAALEALQSADAACAQAKAALGQNHRRRLELVQRLRALVAA